MLAFFPGKIEGISEACHTAELGFFAYGGVRFYYCFKNL